MLNAESGRPQPSKIPFVDIGAFASSVMEEKSAPVAKSTAGSRAITLQNSKSSCDSARLRARLHANLSISNPSSVTNDVGALRQ